MTAPVMPDHVICIQIYNCKINTSLNDLMVIP